MIFNWLKSKIAKTNEDSDIFAPNSSSLFRVIVVDFADNIDADSGRKVAQILAEKEGIQVSFFNEPFAKSFLNLEGRTIFDLIDKGQDILDKTESHVLVWGYREGNKIRLNFQADKLYDTEEYAFVSLLDSLYIPDSLINNMPEAISNLIYGGIISALKTFTKESKIRKKYLLRKIIDQLSRDNSAKSLGIEYMPYIMNFLGIIYLSFAFENTNDKDFKITKNLFETALKHQELIENPIHLGCIYNHLGQLCDCATEYMDKKPLAYYKGAINYYRYAQKYLSKYNYPYDYGYISYKLSQLFFNFWRQKEDIQALRDAVFQLREVEKIYTYALFPEFWAIIQGNLGYMLSLLGALNKNPDISELAIAAYKNQQKIITERKDPLSWAKIQEKIGDIYYSLGKAGNDKDLIEESLEYFHDALYIFENAGMDSDIKSITTTIQKASHNLSMI